MLGSRPWAERRAGDRMGRRALVSRDSARDAVMHRFWSAGYAATSLDELLSSSGMHRGSFYRAFGDKRGAFDAALERYGDLIAKEDIEPSATGSGSPTRRLMRLLYARLDTVLGISPTFTRAPGTDADAHEAAGHPGCLVVNTALELAPHDEAMRAVVADGLQAVQRVIALLI